MFTCKPAVGGGSSGDIIEKYPTTVDYSSSLVIGVATAGASPTSSSMDLEALLVLETIPPLEL